MPETEARIALLSSGRKLSKAEMRFTSDAEEWLATVSPAVGDPVALAFADAPKDEEGGNVDGGAEGAADDDGAVLERIGLVETFFAARDRMFASFLRLCADEGLWREVCARMCAWAGEVGKEMVAGLPNGGKESPMFREWLESCG